MFQLLRRMIRFSLPRPQRALPKQGQVYDLSELYEEIKARYFTPDYNAAIGWSNRSRKGAFRSMTFGTYDRRRHQIRINRMLDDPHVPRLFVEFIVYHEMLHAVCLPFIDRCGRVKIHTPEFKRKERLFPHFHAAKAWSRTSLEYFRRKHGRS